MGGLSSDDTEAVELLRQLCLHADSDRTTAVAQRNVLRDLMAAGMSLTEVAHELGKSVPTVKQMLTGPA